MFMMFGVCVLVAPHRALGSADVGRMGTGFLLERNCTIETGCHIQCIPWS